MTSIVNIYQTRLLNETIIKLNIIERHTDLGTTINTIFDSQTYIVLEKLTNSYDKELMVALLHFCPFLILFVSKNNRNYRLYLYVSVLINMNVLQFINEYSILQDLFSNIIKDRYNDYVYKNVYCCLNNYNRSLYDMLTCLDFDTTV